MPYYMHELNPDYNPATGLLQHLTTEELKQLLNDDERLEAMIKDLQQVKRSEAEREMLLASNKSLAEFNLSQEPNISTSKNQLKESYNQLMKLKDDVEDKKQKLDGVTRQMSLDTTLALLQAAAAESEEESEAISENFLSGEITVDAFLEQYLKKRKSAHLRRVKAEKMVELLQNFSSVPNFTPSPSRTASQPVPPQLQNHAFGYPPSYPANFMPAPGGMPMPYYR